MSYPFGKLDSIERWYAEERHRIEVMSPSSLDYERRRRHLDEEYQRRKYEYYSASGMTTGPGMSSLSPTTMGISMAEFEELQDKRKEVYKLKEEIKRMKNPIRTKIEDIDKRVLLINHK